MWHREFCRASYKSVWLQEAKPDPCPHNHTEVEDSKFSPFWILAPPVPLDPAVPSLLPPGSRSA